MTWAKGFERIKVERLNGNTVYIFKPDVFKTSKTPKILTKNSKKNLDYIKRLLYNINNNNRVPKYLNT